MGHSSRRRFPGVLQWIKTPPWAWLLAACCCLAALSFARGGLQPGLRWVLVGMLAATLASAFRHFLQLKPVMRAALLVFLLLNYALLELGAWLILKKVAPEGSGNGSFVETRLQITGDQRLALKRIVGGEKGPVRWDPVIGWSHRTLPEEGNPHGLRGPVPNLSPVPEPGRLRVACMGDSYTYGAEVGDDECWPALAAPLVPGSEFLNFGISGTGPTQSYLNFIHYVKPLRPDVVVIGFMRANFFRTVNVYRPFLRPDSGPPIPQPFASLEKGQLVVHPQPVTEAAGLQTLLDDPRRYLEDLARRDYLMRAVSPTPPQGTPLWKLGYRILRRPPVRSWVADVLSFDPFPQDLDLEDIENSPFDFDPWLLEVNRQLLAAYIKAVRETGAQPIFLMYASKGDVQHFNRSRKPVYHALLEGVRAEGVPVLEVAPALAAAFGNPIPAADIFMPRGHYNAAGNAVVARLVAEELQRHGAGHGHKNAPPSPSRPQD